MHQELPSSMPTDPFRARWIECEAVCLKTKEFLSHFLDV